MSEVQKILLTFEKNAVDAWKENKSDVAIVRKLRPNRTEAEQALYDLLMEEAVKASWHSAWQVGDCGGGDCSDGTHYTDDYSIPVSTINELFGRTE